MKRLNFSPLGRQRRLTFDMKKVDKSLFAYFASLILVFLYLARFISGLADNDLQVIFFDVGQGDSIFIRLPDRRCILIDGGVDNTVIYRLGKYLPYFERQIDLVIMTHTDADHLNGLVEVCRRFQVKAIMFSPVESAEPAYQELLREIERKSIRQIRPEDYYRLEIGNGSDFEIFNPKDEIACSDVNDCSVVARLKYRNISYLFTGDISSKQEDILLRNYTNLSADILKVAHHGSRYSTKAEFIKEVSPKLAVISVGKNNFKHPGAELIERLAAAGVKILTTLENGDIMITSDGIKYRLGY